MRALARLLIAREAREKGSSRAPFAVLERLRSPLGTLMGTGGFRALVVRALALAREEVPWLRTVRAKANGTLESFEEIHPQVPPRECFEGRVEVLAHLLTLLVSFIGQGMTSRLVGEIWRHPHGVRRVRNRKKRKK